MIDYLYTFVKMIGGGLLLLIALIMFISTIKALFSNIIAAVILMPFAILFLSLGIYLIKHARKKKSSEAKCRTEKSMQDDSMNEHIEYLVFDVETTGLPKNWKAPISKLSNWPRIVQIGWYSYDKQENLLESKSYIIKPNGFSIPEASKKIHGISTNFAEKNGYEIELVLSRFTELVKKTNYLIAHNLDFDEKVVRSELLRADISDHFDGKIRMCTKEIGTNICKIPGKYGYKWPTLSELYNHLFDDNLKGSHDASNDAKAAADCFFELKRIKAF